MDELSSQTTLKTYNVFHGNLKAFKESLLDTPFYINMTIDKTTYVVQSHDVPGGKWHIVSLCEHLSFSEKLCAFLQRVLGDIGLIY